MKKLLVGLLFTAAAAAPAIAADIPVKAPPPVIETWDWTGFYSGIDAGWRENRQHVFRVTSPGVPEFNHDRNQAFGSSHWGVQWQYMNFVLGVEGSYNFGKWFQQGSPNGGCPAGPPVFCYTAVDQIFTIGPRAGIVVNRNVLLYGTGGYANGKNYIFANNGPIVVDTGSARHGGWFAGGGVDWMVAHTNTLAVVVGAEYKHIDLGTSRVCSSIDNFACTADVSDIRTRIDSVAVRATLLWNGFGSPVRAAY
jgi:outer membrane immunogenic protein